MKMTPAVVLVGRPAPARVHRAHDGLLAYARQDTTPSEFFRARTAEENAAARSTSPTLRLLPHAVHPQLRLGPGAERIAAGRRLRRGRADPTGLQRTGIGPLAEGGEHPETGTWRLHQPALDAAELDHAAFEWLGPERIGS